MTLADWLGERSSDAPPRLAARIREALGDGLRAPRADATTICVDAADSLLRDLLARGSTGRDSALDLLTVDALVTYAFEAAAADAATLGDRASAAAARLAASAHA